jgi:hypothetical protein
VNKPHRVRGHSKKLYKDFSHKDIRKHNFTYRVVDPWNSLPEKVISAPSINSFERRLDKFWGNQDLRFDFKKCLKISHANDSPFNYGTVSDSEEEDLVREVT